MPEAGTVERCEHTKEYFNVICGGNCNRKEPFEDSQIDVSKSLDGCGEELVEMCDG